MKDPHDMFKQPQDPRRYISGIYNYCDRWCERCAFKHRCAVYDRDSMDMNEESGKVDNDKFLEKLSESFKAIRSMIENEAKKQGIDLEELAKPDPAFEKRLKEIDENIEQHPLSQASKMYFDKVHNWFENKQQLYNDKGEEMSSSLLMGITDEDEAMSTLRELNDITEVIRWYSPQIHVKLKRALDGCEDLFESDPAFDDMPSDSDGSAKVALIGMDRSIGAWNCMRKHFPEEADELLDFLVILERLRRSTEKKFPNARNFIRPGFDTGEDVKW